MISQQCIFSQKTASFLFLFQSIKTISLAEDTRSFLSSVSFSNHGKATLYFGRIRLEVIQFQVPGYGLKFGPNSLLLVLVAPSRISVVRGIIWGSYNVTRKGIEPSPHHRSRRKNSVSNNSATQPTFWYLCKSNEFQVILRYFGILVSCKVHS